MKRATEWMLNLICLVALLYVGATLMYPKLRNAICRLEAIVHLNIGSHFSIPNIPINHHRACSALSTACHYCTASAPFYEHLMEYQTKGDPAAYRHLPPVGK